MSHFFGVYCSSHNGQLRSAYPHETSWLLPAASVQEALDAFLEILLGRGYGAVGGEDEPLVDPTIRYELKIMVGPMNPMCIDEGLANGLEERTTFFAEVSDGQLVGPPRLPRPRRPRHGHGHLWQGMDPDAPDHYSTAALI
jgi:hypothetical protein